MTDIARFAYPVLAASHAIISALYSHEGVLLHAGCTGFAALAYLALAFKHLKANDEGHGGAMRAS